MNLSRYIKKAAFFTKNSAARGHAISQYHRLMTNQAKSLDEINQINWDKKREIVEYAYNHTKYYRRVFDAAGFKPQDLRKPEDFYHLPILTKQDIRNNFDDIIAEGVTPAMCAVSTTGGSTGEPLKLLHDKRVPKETIGWRMLSWWGVSPADDVAFIYRLKRNRWQKFKNSFLWWPTRRIYLDASYLTEEKIRTFIEEYERVKPVYIEGYVGGVYEFGQFLKRNNIEVSAPQAIWLTSAPLTETQREELQTIIRAPAYDQYGSCEIHWLAAECQEQNGLHQFHDVVNIEFVDENKQEVPLGEYGSILVSDLCNKVFPIIRYEIGDRGRGIAGNCPCGVNLPLMEKVKGRVSDNIRMPGGNVISGEYLTTIFDSHPGCVTNFQVYQAQDYSVTIRGVLGEHQDAQEIAEQVRAQLAEKVQNEVPVSIEYLSHIDHDQGKLRFIVSDLKSS